jgi:hypothetical protein
MIILFIAPISKFTLGLVEHCMHKSLCYLLLVYACNAQVQMGPIQQNHQCHLVQISEGCRVRAYGGVTPKLLLALPHLSGIPFYLSVYAYPPREGGREGARAGPPGPPGGGAGGSKGGRERDSERVRESKPVLGIHTPCATAE